MRYAVALVVFLSVLMTPALADNGLNAAAKTTVYVFSPPEVEANVHQVDGGLQCTWTIADKDEGDAFIADISWLREGELIGLTDEVTGCTVSERCASAVIAPARRGEEWACSVKVTDSFGAVGESTAKYGITPLGFLSGIVEAVSSAFCSWLHFC